MRGGLARHGVGTHRTSHRETPSCTAQSVVSAVSSLQSQQRACTCTYHYLANAIILAVAR